MEDKLAIFTGNSNLGLAEEISQHLRIKLGERLSVVKYMYTLNIK